MLLLAWVLRAVGGAGSQSSWAVREPPLRVGSACVFEFSG